MSTMETSWCRMIIVKGAILRSGFIFESGLWNVKMLGNYGFTL